MFDDKSLAMQYYPYVDDGDSQLSAGELGIEAEGASFSAQVQGLTESGCLEHSRLPVGR